MTLGFSETRTVSGTDPSASAEATVTQTAHIPTFSPSVQATDTQKLSKTVTISTSTTQTMSSSLSTTDTRVITASLGESVTKTIPVFNSIEDAVVVSSLFSLRLDGSYWATALGAGSTAMVAILRACANDVAGHFGLPVVFVTCKNPRVGSLIVDVVISRNASYEIPDQVIMSDFNSGTVTFTDLQVTYHNVTNQTNDTISLLSVSILMGAPSSAKTAASSYACDSTMCIPAIAGSVAGGVILFIAAGAVICIRRYRRRRAKEKGLRALSRWYDDPVERPSDGTASQSGVVRAGSPRRSTPRTPHSPSRRHRRVDHIPAAVRVAPTAMAVTDPFTPHFWFGGTASPHRSIAEGNGDVSSEEEILHDPFSPPRRRRLSSAAENNDDFTSNGQQHSWWWEVLESSQSDSPQRGDVHTRPRRYRHRPDSKASSFADSTTTTTVEVKPKRLVPKIPIAISSVPKPLSEVAKRSDTEAAPMPKTIVTKPSQVPLQRRVAVADSTNQPSGGAVLRRYDDGKMIKGAEDVMNVSTAHRSLTSVRNVAVAANAAVAPVSHAALLNPTTVTMTRVDRGWYASDDGDAASDSSDAHIPTEGSHTSTKDRPFSSSSPSAASSDPFPGDVLPYRGGGGGGGGVVTHPLSREPFFVPEGASSVFVNDPFGDDDDFSPRLPRPNSAAVHQQAEVDSPPVVVTVHSDAESDSDVSSSHQTHVDIRDEDVFVRSVSSSSAGSLLLSTASKKEKHWAGKHRSSFGSDSTGAPSWNAFRSAAAAADPTHAYLSFSRRPSASLRTTSLRQRTTTLSSLHDPFEHQLRQLAEADAWRDVGRGTSPATSTTLGDKEEVVDEAFTNSDDKLSKGESK